MLSSFFGSCCCRRRFARSLLAVFFALQIQSVQRARLRSKGRSSNGKKETGKQKEPKFQEENETICLGFWINKIRKKNQYSGVNTPYGCCRRNKLNSLNTESYVWPSPRRLISSNRAKGWRLLNRVVPYKHFSPPNVPYLLPFHTPFPTTPLSTSFHVLSPIQAFLHHFTPYPSNRRTDKLSRLVSTKNHLVGNLPTDSIVKIQNDCNHYH